MSTLEHITDEELYAALAQQDYVFYLEYTNKGRYHHATHTRYICEALQRVERGDLTRLIITLPPRHSKSHTVTEAFPSYFIGKDPSRRVIAVSYGDALAKRFGRANRAKLEEHGHIFGIQLSYDNATATNWSIANHAGGMISAGVGGSITGEGADLLLIDDPIKNRQEANSETYREALWHEWENTLLTRLQPNGRIIIISTRWHEDDLVGRLLAQQPHIWTHITLPAAAEEDDPLGRVLGGPLWPEFGFDHDWLDETKRAVGSYAWVSLYQQRPSPLGGSLFHRGWWKFYRQPPSEFDSVIQSWDCAFKDTQSSDYVVGQVWGKQGANKYLLDQVRARMDLPDTLRAITTVSSKWPQSTAKLIEDKANGPAVIQLLQNKIPGLIPVNPQGGKEVRAHAASPDVEAGNVYLPEDAPWIHDFIEEHAAFPTGKYDDQVDSMTQAIIHMNKKSRQAVAVGRP